MNLSRAWTRLGRLDLAIEHLRRAVEFGDLTQTRKGQVGQWVYEVGDLLVKAGKQAEAIETFREAAARNPSNFRPHYRLAQEYRRLRDRVRTLDALNEAMRLNPNDSDIIKLKVMSVRDLDPQNTEILALARRWVGMKPDEAQANYCLSDELRKAGQVGEAIDFARAAAALNPRNALYPYHLAQLLVFEARLGEALAAIDEAILLEPDKGRRQHFRGEILLKMERHEEARSALEAATRRSDAQPRHFRMLAKICKLLGDEAGASQALEKALAPST